ncbi:hypothetical protein [Glaesserella parasuis]|uniref:hypothetical protein n=1 Tax=Glaesserella parasuis TaxID=738 RepID=UPI0013A6ED0D|nr:hypothetical protein [Glaesserella parasuis]
MVGQDPPYKLLPPQVGKSQKYLSPTPIIKKKKKHNDLHKTKNKITRIFQRLSIKVRNNRRKSNESGDLDGIFVYYAEIIGS